MLNFLLNIVVMLLFSCTSSAICILVFRGQIARKARFEGYWQGKADGLEQAARELQKFEEGQTGLKDRQSYGVLCVSEFEDEQNA